MSVFRGRYYHSIDEKGRIIFPAKLCDIFAEHYDNRLVMTSWDGYLLVFPYAEWTVIEEKMFQQSIIRKEVREFQRLFMSGAVDCTLDSQRRILIPPSLRRDAGLERDIVTAGMGRSIEIWDKDRFDAALEKTSRNVELYSQYIADLGI
ncbi:MAG TPA: division/cell wall cluster transcriptional repressor MraZ [Deltaproteobacteria bacterium]|nr:division/cell wall cluster transcriptional repressor MraZ [Deltaproteobacteria bacterium]